MAKKNYTVNYDGCLELLRNVSLDSYRFAQALGKEAEKGAKLAGLTRYLEKSFSFPWDITDDHNWEMLDQAVNDVIDFLKAAKEETMEAHKNNMELMKKFSAVLEQVEKITTSEELKGNPEVTKLQEITKKALAS